MNRSPDNFFPAPPLSPPAAATQRRLLALGPEEGWHAEQLRQAAAANGHSLAFAAYETLAVRSSTAAESIVCSAGALSDYDAVICRTMPRGSLEQINFRLAALHAAESAGICLVNSPATLELAIDKCATLSLVRSLGYRIPPTVTVQSRAAALAAFDELGGDVVVKPLFGGEGRGVMRIQDRQLAWYTFSTLEQLGAVIYVQRFVPPGGRDLRLLVIGDQIFGLRRHNPHDFRTNISGGAACWRFDPPPPLIATAQRIAATMALQIGSIDLLDGHDCGELQFDADQAVIVEVNGVPGWRGAQRCLDVDLAQAMIRHVVDQASRPRRPEPSAAPESSAAPETSAAADQPDRSTNSIRTNELPARP